MLNKKVNYSVILPHMLYLFIPCKHSKHSIATESNPELIGSGEELDGCSALCKVEVAKKVQGA